MVFRAVDSFYYAFHATGAAAGTWSGGVSAFYTPLVNVPSLDPYGSHWSVAVDSSSDLHVAMAIDAHLVYAKWNGSSWTVTGISPDITAHYPQCCVLADDTVVLMANDMYSYIRVWKSYDSGATFARTDTLRHPVVAEGSGISYPNPRIEVQAAFSAWPTPVLLQYSDNGTFKVMRYF
jgi:hypothetical protein